MQYYLYKCPSFLLGYMSILQSSIWCVRRNLSGVSGGSWSPCDLSSVSGGSLTPVIDPVCPEDPSPWIYRSGGPRSPSGVCGGSQVTHLAGVCVRGHPAIYPVGPRPPCDLLPCTSTQCVWCIQGDPACKSLICATKNISMQCTKKLLKNLSFLIYSPLFGYVNHK